jgi:hypothetical protein
MPPPVWKPTEYVRCSPSGAQDRLSTQFDGAGMAQVRVPPAWPGIASTSIIALPLPETAEPETGQRATATRLPSALTATDVMVLPLNTGPKP